MRNHLLSGLPPGRQCSWRPSLLGPGSLSSCLSGHKREGLLQSHGGLLLPTGRVLSRFISSLMALEPPSARTPQPEGLSLSPGLLACLQDNFAPQPAEEKFPHSPCTKPLPLKRPKASFKRPSWVLVPPRQGAAPGNSARPIARDRRGTPVSSGQKTARLRSHAHAQERASVGMWRNHKLRALLAGV